MRNIFGSGPQSELLEFLGLDPLLVFDYDGTLCPIVQQAAQAVMRPETRSSLRSLCVRSICALLSGRARADVLAHVEGIPFAQVIGSHGEDWLVPRVGDSSRRKKISRVFAELDRELGHLEGVKIEDKGLSLSVHYRHALNRRATRAAIAGFLGGLRDFRSIGGKAVFNVLPKESGGKGQALIELKKMFGKSQAVYVGDDLTDEEVFTLPARECVFKIRVGYSAVSKADYYLPSQKRIDLFLRMLLEGRSMKSAA